MIRRVLVQKLERIAQNLIELSLAPTDQDLEQYYQEQSERYRPPSLITFTHVFVDPDKRGDRAIADNFQELHKPFVNLRLGDVTCFLFSFRNEQVTHHHELSGWYPRLRGVPSGMIGLYFLMHGDEAPVGSQE